MTRTKEILKLLADGEPWTFKSLAEHFGIPEHRVRSSISALKIEGLIETVPLSYVITADGIKRANWIAKSSQKRIERASVNRRARNARLKIAETLRANGFVTDVFQLGARQ